MKRILLFVAGLCLLMSCDGNQAAVKFGEDFAAALVKGDKAALAKLYPSLTEADHPHFVFDKNDVKASKVGDVIVAHYSGGVEFDIVKKDKDYVAVASRGLFQYPADKMEVALPLGQYNPSLTDKENSLRMSDLGFERYLESEFLPARVNPLRCGVFNLTFYPELLIDSASGYVSVENVSEEPVRGSDYYLEYTYRLIRMDVDQKSEVTRPGVDILPRGATQFDIMFNAHDDVSDFHVVYNIGSTEMIRRFYKNPVGTEYAEFESKYGALSVDPLPDAPKGTKILSGTIGSSKVNGTITFEGNSFKGRYGYLGKTTGIRIEGQLRSGGRFSATEWNESKNTICGFYFGNYSEDALMGNFTNHHGGRYNASLKLN